MRRRVSGHTAPNTSSSSSVRRSFRRLTSTAHQAPPSRSNNSMVGASLTTITISSPVPPSSVSLRRSALAQRSSSTARPGAFPSMGSVCGARLSGGFQRTSLKGANSRNTKSRTPSACFPTTAYEPAESVSKRVAAAERTQLAATVTKHASYGRRSTDCFADSATWCRNAHSTSYSRVVNVADKDTRVSRELTTVDSRSLDIDGTNDSRRPTSWESFENLRSRRDSTARTIDIRSISIHPILHKSPQPPMLSVSSQSKMKLEWASELRPLESSASESLSSVDRPRSSEHRGVRRNASLARVRSVMESRKNASTSPGAFAPKAPDAFFQRLNSSTIGRSDFGAIGAKPALQKPVQTSFSPPAPLICSPSQMMPLNSGTIQSKPNLMKPVLAFNKRLKQGTCSSQPPPSLRVSQETALNSRSIIERAPTEIEALKQRPGSVHPFSSQSSVCSADAKLTNPLDSQYSRDLIQFSRSKSIESAAVTLMCPESRSLSSRLQDVPLVEIKTSSPHHTSRSKQGQCIDVKSSVPLELQLVLAPPAGADLRDVKRSTSRRSILRQQDTKAGQLTSPATKPLQLSSSSRRSVQHQAIEPRSITPLSAASPPNVGNNFGRGPTNIISRALSMDNASSLPTSFGLQPAQSSTIPSLSLPRGTENELKTALTEWTSWPTSSKTAESQNPSTLRSVELEPGQTNATIKHARLACAPKNCSSSNVLDTSFWTLHSKTTSHCALQNGAHRRKQRSPELRVPMESQPEKFDKQGQEKYEPLKRLPVHQTSELGTIDPVLTESKLLIPDYLPERHTDSPAGYSFCKEDLPAKVSSTQNSLSRAHLLASNSVLTSPASPKRPSFTVYESKSSDVLNNNSQSSQIYSTHGNTTERFRRYSLRQQMSIETISEASEELRQAGAKDGLNATPSELRSSSTADENRLDENRKLADFLPRTAQYSKVTSAASPPFYSFASDEMCYEIVAKSTQLASLSSSKFKQYVFPAAEETLPSEPCFLRPVSSHPVDANSKTAREKKSPPSLSRVHIFGSFELTDEDEAARVPGTENELESSVRKSHESTSEDRDVTLKSEYEVHEPMAARGKSARSLEFPSLESRACAWASHRSGEADLNLRSLVPLDLNSVKAYSSKEGSSSMNILLQFDLLKLLESSGETESAAKSGPRAVLLGTKSNAKNANTLLSAKHLYAQQRPKPGYRCYTSSSTSVDGESVS